MQVSKKNLYDSCAMYHPDGTLMCYTDIGRATWYVSHDLAEWNGENSFKLKFIPNGYGKPDSDFYLQKVDKKCVVCGTNQQGLNKHHIVPYVFRSRMPLEYKTSNHHDVVLTCGDCHESYEDYADEFKKSLAQQYGVVMYVKPTEEMVKALKIKRAQRMIKQIENGKLQNKEGKVLIPPHRLDYLRNLASTPFQEREYKGAPWADHIMKKVVEESKLFDFVKQWRQHFVKYAKPQHMPKYWSIDFPLETIVKNVPNSIDS